MSAVSLKAGVASAVTAIAVMAGGLFLVPGLVGAQTPEPTPAAPQEQQATPAPSDGGTRPSKEECDEMRDSSGSGSSTGLRGGRASQLRY